MSTSSFTVRQVLATAALAVSIGLLTGIYVQHRWPVGRWRLPKAPPPTPAQERLETLRAVPSEKRLALLIVGQSNAANYGGTRGAGGHGVFAFHDGRLYAAVDPLPGGDGTGGSIWTRLGARLIHTATTGNVVFAVAALGSTRAADWARGGFCHERLLAQLRGLQAAGLPPDFVLWQQGESEAGDATHAGRAYAAALESIHRTCREHFPQTRFVAARASLHHGIPRNEQISLAQTATAASFPGALRGPDIDSLDAPFRSDGVHLNNRGLAAAADLWLEALRPALAARDSPPMRP